MKPTQRYDVLVLGTSLQGLVAAALLAQRGQRVLVVPHDPLGTWEAGGQQLPLFPELLPAPKSLPALRATLDELALAAPVQRLIQPVPLQVVMEGARLELGEAELARALGPLAAPAAGALARLAATEEELAPAVAGPSLLPASLGERLRLWRHRRAHRSRFEAVLVLDGAGPLLPALRALHRFAATDAGEPDGLAFARATVPLLRGLHRLPPGGLATLLAEHVRARRGDVLGGQAAQEIVLEGGRFAGVQVGGALWRAELLLAALPLERTLALLPDGRRRDKLAALAPAQATAPVVRNLLLAPEAIPPGLGPLTLAVGEAGACGLLELRDGPLATWAGFGSEEALEGLLEELLPFYRRHVRLEARPPVAHVRVAGGVAPATPIPGVLAAGPELLPALGLDGAVLAGRALADHAGRLAGRARTGTMGRNRSGGGPVSIA